MGCHSGSDGGLVGQGIGETCGNRNVARVGLRGFRDPPAGLLQQGGRYPRTVEAGRNASGRRREPPTFTGIGAGRQRHSPESGAQPSGSDGQIGRFESCQTRTENSPERPGSIFPTMPRAGIRPLPSALRGDLHPLRVNRTRRAGLERLREPSDRMRIRSDSNTGRSGPARGTYDCR